MGALSFNRREQQELFSKLVTEFDSKIWGDWQTYLLRRKRDFFAWLHVGRRSLAILLYGPCRFYDLHLDEALMSNHRRNGRVVSLDWTQGGRQ